MSPRTSPIGADSAKTVNNVIRFVKIHSLPHFADCEPSSSSNPLFSVGSAGPNSNSPVNRAVPPHLLADVVAIQAGLTGD